MSDRKPPTEREMLVGTCRAFLLLGVFFVGHAVYKFYDYQKFEEKTGLKLMSDWSVYVRLYEWGGKWAVVKFILVLSAVCLTASAVAGRRLRKMPLPE